MGVLSGIFGAVDTIHTVRNWSVDSSADLQELVASNTKGMPIRLEGNEDWSGSFSCFGDVPVKMPGDSFLFTGSVDGENGCYGQAVVDSVEVSVDIEAGAPISHDVSFSGDGILTLGAAIADDTTVPEGVPSIGCKVLLGTVAAVPAWTELDNVRTIGLSFESANQAYVSSSTAGKTRRLIGNLNASVSVSLYEGDPTKIIVPNTLRGLRLFTNKLYRVGTLVAESATVTISTTGLVAGQSVAGEGIPADTAILSVGTGEIVLTKAATATGDKTLNFHRFWEFNWIRFSEASGFEVDREGGALVAYSLSGGFSGFAQVGVTQTEGHIKRPDLTTWWPAV